MRNPPQPSELSWIPSLRCWINAIALILLLWGLQHIIVYIWIILAVIFRFAPQLLYLFGLLAQLSPIIVVAFLHHWLHQILDAYFPESQLPEMHGEMGPFPSIFSWWEGLYGWLIFTLSIVIVFYIERLFFPHSGFLNLLAFSSTQSFPPLSIPRFISQFIIGAYLYHFESLVHQRLRTAYRQ